MIYGLYLSGAGAKAESLRQDVIANNLANSTTVAFKRQLAIFRQRLAEVLEGGHRRQTSLPMLDRLGGGLWPDGTFSQFAQGALQHTGSPLDVALSGRGFLTVAAQGKTLLTRDGRLRIVDGVLTTSGGPVLDEAGSVIRLSADRPVTIGPDGTVRQDGEVIGRLRRVDVARPEQLRPVGQGLYEASSEEPWQASEARVEQGYVEQSAVEPVKELVALIESHRLFEANVNLMRMQDATIGRLVNDVPRVT